MLLGINTQKYICFFPQTLLWDQYYTDSKVKDTTKRNFQANILMNIDTKIPNKILTSHVKHHIERIMHHNQMGFI